MDEIAATIQSDETGRRPIRRPMRSSRVFGSRSSGTSGTPEGSPSSCLDCARQRPTHHEDDVNRTSA